MSGLSFATLFFVSCVGSVLFFTLGRFVGASEESQRIRKKLNQKKRKEKPEPKVHGDNVVDITRHFSSEEDDDKERAIEILSSYALVYSKKHDKYVRVPREFERIINTLE